MTTLYKVKGMTCGGCVSAVSKALEEIDGVSQAKVSLSPSEALVTNDKGISLDDLNLVLSQKGKFRLEYTDAVASNSQELEKDEATQTWVYYPLLLVFGFVLISSVVSSGAIKDLDFMLLMRHFMGWFFLWFSFFKFLDIKGFSTAFSGYDPIAKRVSAYGLAYPYIELGLGLAYLLSTNVIGLSLATIVILSITTFGVIRVLMNKQSIQCACIGTGFNLPMSTVTIVENALMVSMAAIMLIRSLL